MLDFHESRKRAFEEFSRYNSSKVLSFDEKKQLNFSAELEIWEVISEVENTKGMSDDFTFYIKFNPDFPLSIPKIYLSKADYNRVKHIPHADTNGFICTFDTETIRTDVSNPGGIVCECFYRAKSIVEAGIKKTNVLEFNDEFNAYWEISYAQNDEVKDDYLSLLPDTITNPVKLLKFDSLIGGYLGVFHQDDDHANNFIAWLKSINIKFKESKVFFAGDIPQIQEPPFLLTNAYSLTLIQSLDLQKQKEFKSYLKAEITPVVLFSKTINQQVCYYGWRYKKLDLFRKGFRPGVITPQMALERFQKNETVIRLAPANYTPRRLSIRTAGKEPPVKNTIFIAGLGSIGSNLAYFLDSLENPNFIFADSDRLKIENLPRHLLTIYYVNEHKVDGMKRYLLSKNQHRTITPIKKSIIDIINKEPEVINGCHSLFVCVGKDNIDDYIADAISAGKITVPTYFMWVEPFLAGGHCLYIHPENATNYKSYFDQDGYFIYNVIDKTEYQANNPLLNMREAGCQSSYTPFSNADLILFLSAIFPEIAKLQEKQETTTGAFTWIGDIKTIREKNLKISEAASGGSPRSLKMNKH